MSDTARQPPTSTHIPPPPPSPPSRPPSLSINLYLRTEINSLPTLLPVRFNCAMADIAAGPTERNQKQKNRTWLLASINPRASSAPKRSENQAVKIESRIDSFGLPNPIRNNPISMAPSDMRVAPFRNGVDSISSNPPIKRRRRIMESSIPFDGIFGLASFLPASARSYRGTHN